MHVSIHHSINNHVMVLNKGHKHGKVLCGSYESSTVLIGLKDEHNNKKDVKMVYQL